jgi:hypothetical protein
MEGPEWTDREESRPQPPPRLGLEAARALLGPGLYFLAAHPDLPSCRHSALGSMPAALRALEKAERCYSDDMPKSAVGEAHEWNKCRAAAETLMALGKAYRALIMEEETT